MIFKYKDITVQKFVELDIDNIRAHQSCLIRAHNMNPDGSLIYNETIDDSLIQLIPENVPEEKMLLGEISANNFYFDSVRNRYLGLDTLTLNFYSDGTNKKNIYMYGSPGIFTNTVPYRIFGEHVIIAAEGYSANAVPTGTNAVEIRTMPTGTPILTLSNNSGSSVTEFFNDNYDVVVPDASKLAAFILNFGLDAPVVLLQLKKTYYPVGT